MPFKDALSQSEEMYRTLFNNTNEGFCVIEVIFDAQDKPVDWRYLEVNSAFEQKTGLHDAKGKLISQLITNLEDHWFEFYGQIALSGQPACLTDEVMASNRWFEVSAFRLGGPTSRKVAALFDDVTERKRVEAVKMILEAKEAEKQQIGRDIHEGLCQELAGIALLIKAMGRKLTTLAPAQSVEAIQISEIINQSIASTRSLVQKLSS